jgi:hypothetical protein
MNALDGWGGRQGRRHRRPGLVAAFLGLLGASPRPAPAQTADSLFHVTLAGWEERTWLRLADRQGSYWGRTSTRGILQRFHPDMDQEYQLDVIASRPSLVDDYRWDVSTTGFRWHAGSINKEFVETIGEFKVPVPIAAAWRAEIEWDHESNYEARRSMVHLRFVRRWPSGLEAFAGTSLEPKKPGWDLETGVAWTARSGASARLSLNLLDWPNDFIYQVLDAASASEIDSSLDYTAPPFAFRGRARVPVGPVWLEAFGAAMTPATVQVYANLAADSGYAQDERAAYAGALIETEVAARVRAGLYGSVVRTRIQRAALPDGVGVEEFDLVEREAMVGAFVIAEPLPRLYGEAWLVRQWRPEQREVTGGSLEAVVYEDRAWMGQAMLIYRTPAGFQADLGVLMDARAVVRNVGEVGSRPLDADHYRLRFGLGWYFGPQFAFMIGLGADLDGNDGRWFDGARGRFQVYW